jgi:signal transduction histidine kinase
MTATVDLTSVAVPPTRPAVEAGRHLFDPSRLSGLVRALRWGAIAVGLALGSADIRSVGSRTVIWAVVLGAHAGLASVHRVWRTGGLTPITVDLVVTTMAVIATGGWKSPFVFTMFVVIIEAATATSFWPVALVTGATATLVTVGGIVVDDGTGIRVATQWSFELIMVALLAGVVRTVSVEAAHQRTLTADRITQLAEANDLLASLQRVAQQLPASLDLASVVDDAITRAHDLIHFDRGAIVLFDDTVRHWDVVRARGVKALGPYEEHTLPPVLAHAARTERAEAVTLDRTGLHEASVEGVYAPLWARGNLVGVVAFEYDSPTGARARNVEMVGGLVDALALAVDNARLFARLRTLGADEERIRIARELHDRIGQSLSYLAFELDRLVSHVSDTDTIRRLEHLRIDVRSVIGEVRDTLYDLRTDLPAEGDPSSIMRSFLDRVKERTGILTWLDVHSTGRLPILQEQELWRIAKEAITNVERHAKAKRVVVRWECDGRSSSVEITDDGVGFAPNAAGPDSFGLLGMRERAASIGARLEISSKPGGGTTIRAVMPPR